MHLYLIHSKNAVADYVTFYKGGEKQVNLSVQCITFSSVVNSFKIFCLQVEEMGTTQRQKIDRNAEWGRVINIGEFPHGILVNSMNLKGMVLGLL